MKGASASARVIDHKIKSGEKIGPFVPACSTIKDNICYKGHKVSAGSKILENFASLYNATVVERLLAEDAIIIGRTNCDEFAMGSSNENSAYGRGDVLITAPDITPCSWRFFRGLGSSRSGNSKPCIAGLRYRWFYPPTGRFLRGAGFKAHLWQGFPLWLIAYASSFDQIGPFAHSLEDHGADNGSNFQAKTITILLPLLRKWCLMQVWLNYHQRLALAIFPTSMLDAAGLTCRSEKLLSMI